MYLPIYLSIYLPIYLSIYLSDRSIYLPVCLSACLPACLPAHLSDLSDLSTGLSIYLPVDRSIALLIQVFVHILFTPRRRPCSQGFLQQMPPVALRAAGHPG